jgi:hypothetical protein
MVLSWMMFASQWFLVAQQCMHDLALLARCCLLFRPLAGPLSLQVVREWLPSWVFLLLETRLIGSLIAGPRPGS